jgi:hypothetical protein
VLFLCRPGGGKSRLKRNWLALKSTHSCRLASKIDTSSSGSNQRNSGSPIGRFFGRHPHRSGSGERPTAPPLPRPSRRPYLVTTALILSPSPLVIRHLRRPGSNQPRDRLETSPRLMFHGKVARVCWAALRTGTGSPGSRLFEYQSGLVTRPRAGWPRRMETAAVRTWR